MWSRFSRERRLWCFAAFLVVAYLVLAATGNLLLERLSAWDLLAPTVAAGVVAAAGGTGIWIVRQGLDFRQLFAVALFGGLFLWILLALDIVQERVHLVQYAVLAVVLEMALAERWGLPGKGWRWPELWAVVLTGAAGWADEGVQAVMPARYYDLRDVGLNAAGGVLVVGGLAVIRRLERRQGDGQPPRGGS